MQTAWLYQPVIPRRETTTPMGSGWCGVALPFPIPRFLPAVGMTVVVAGMTVVVAGMTVVAAGMTAASFS